MKAQKCDSHQEREKAWPKVAIIVLNWNGWRDTIECLESLQKLDYPDCQVIVVDNGSTDDSVKEIKRRFPHLPLVETGRNLGYAGGNNAGIRYALENDAAYVLIINNDTKLLNSEFLKPAIEVMKADCRIGVMGLKVLVPGGQVQDTILFIPTLVRCIKESLAMRLRTKKPKDYDIQQQVEAVSGVCWLIRTAAIKMVGLLDEDYFMYVEEQDYCYRIKEAGWKIMYCPITSVLHTKECEDENKERVYRQYVYTRRNLVLFLHKHFGFWQAVLLAILFLASSTAKTILSKVRNQDRGFYNTRLLAHLFSEIKWALSGSR